MTISALPPVPLRSDTPANFIIKADNFMAALPTFQQELNALGTAYNLATTTTSSTSNSITIASKSFTVAAGLGFVAGMAITAGSVSSGTNNMAGTVTSYIGTTLIMNATSVNGSGTYTDWIIALGASASGATLGTNSFTGVQNFALGADITAASTINLTSATGNTVKVVGNTGISAMTLGAGMTRFIIFTGTPLLTHHVTNLNLNASGNNVPIEANDSAICYSDGTTTYCRVIKANGLNVYRVNETPLVQQTVLSGPVDSSGLPNFGGSTGSTTVTASGTLIVTAANGTTNRTGSIANPSWTGLSTNGAMYLYLDIDANGTVTTGSTTLEPSYRWGGADVTTNNKFTFNIQEMSGKVGNGSVATQTYRVFVGEVTVAAGVVSAIIWYALMGRYDSGYTATLPGTATSISRNHNLGIAPDEYGIAVLCNTANQGFAIGDEVIPYCQSNASYVAPLTPSATRLVTQVTTGNNVAFIVNGKASGSVAVLTAGSWSYRLWARRGW